MHHMGNSLEDKFDSLFHQLVTKVNLKPTNPLSPGICNENPRIGVAIDTSIILASSAIVSLSWDDSVQYDVVPYVAWTSLVSPLILCIPNGTNVEFVGVEWVVLHWDGSLLRCGVGRWQRADVGMKCRQRRRRVHKMRYLFIKKRASLSTESDLAAIVLLLPPDR